MTSGNVTDIADLVASHEDYKGSHGITLAIIFSVSAILSTLSSSLLIFIVARSRDHFRTTYHRLVLGLSISDILYSACLMTFGAMRPSDVSYAIWNARGNQATCDAMGFLTAAGTTASAFYSCAMNMNCLAMVKYNCSEAYIRTRIEPFLHAFPIGLALTFGVVPLAGKNCNGYGASCQFEPVYKPPHCTGIEYGQVREGFEIPCGRGSDGFPTFYYICFFITMFVPPVVIGVSLGLIYQAFRNQENRTARYGAGALNRNASGAADGAAADGDDGGGGARDRIGRTVSSSITSLRASLARRFRRRAATSPGRPLSRCVIQRATAYSFAFFLTWSWAIIIGICTLALGGEGPPLALWYILVIFQPLQGFFNLLIYMQPRVMGERRLRGQDLSWRQAIARAFRMSLGLECRDGDVPPDAGRWDDRGRRGRWATPVEEESVEIEVPNEESAGNFIEGERVEIHGPDDE